MTLAPKLLRVMGRPSPNCVFKEEDTMGFSGLREAIMIAVLVTLIVAVTKFDLPGWLLPVGLIVSGALLKNSEQRASSQQV